MKKVELIGNTKVIKDEYFINYNTLTQNQRLAENETNDCVVKSFMVAFGINYDTSHKWVMKYFKRNTRKGTYTRLYLDSVLGKIKNGYKLKLKGYSPSHDFSFRDYPKTRLLTNPKYKKPTSYTVSSFLENHPIGRFIVIVDAHAYAVVNGVMYGNEDERYKSLARRVCYVLEVVKTP